MEVIKKEDLRNVVVVITRYFGGIKLGAGGLIRAYTKGAKIGLESGIIIEKILHHRLRIRIEYTLYGMIENYLMTNGYIVDEIIYDDAVNIYVYIKFSELGSFKNTIIDLTSDNVIIEYEDERHLPMKDDKIIK